MSGKQCDPGAARETRLPGKAEIYFFFFLTGAVAEALVDMWNQRASGRLNANLVRQKYPLLICYRHDIGVPNPDAYKDYDEENPGTSISQDQAYQL